VFGESWESWKMGCLNQLPKPPAPGFRWRFVSIPQPNRYSRIAKFISTFPELRKRGRSPLVFSFLERFEPSAAIERLERFERSSLLLSAATVGTIVTVF
jgi:hypothetical protein